MTIALTEETAPLDEVAGMLGLAPAALKRRWRRLHAADGFPPPLPGDGWRWSRQAVRRWMHHVAGPLAEARATVSLGRPNNDNVNDNATSPAAIAAQIAGARAALQEKFGGPAR